jgi:predicted transcriptional regulator of viral defense system
MEQTSPSRPDWNRLFEQASAQQGMFTTKQAAQAGYSPQLLVHYIRTGRAIRVLRGIYRLVHFPASEHEDLVAAWLWSEQAGVVSHQTALALHGLSDIMPSHVHLTLPLGWQNRRFRLPPAVFLHHADVLPEDRAWFGPVPTTSPARTLNDCATAGLSPDVLRQAAGQALARGLVTMNELREVERVLEPFGGLGP